MSVLDKKEIVGLQQGENAGISNADYHAEQLHLSSSNLKLLLKNPQQFYQEKILGNKPPEAEKPHLLLGTYVHSLVLEPSKVAEEYAFFEGWRKAGKDYQQFIEQNPGKLIISKPQKDVGDRLAAATSGNKHVARLLQGGVAELSLASKILEVPVKMRADYINNDQKYIVDLKTTSHPTDPDIFRATVKEFSYDLSAALYCQIAHNTYGGLYEFYWIVVSKADWGCAVYKASTATLTAGAADVTKAIVIYKKCLAAGEWQLTTVQNSVIITDEDVIEI